MHASPSWVSSFLSSESPCFLSTPQHVSFFIVVQELKELQESHEMLDAGTKAGVCGMCLDDSGKGLRLFVTSCTHSLCSNCALQLVQQMGNAFLPCPFCRTPMADFSLTRTRVLPAAAAAAGAATAQSSSTAAGGGMAPEAAAEAVTEAAHTAKKAAVPGESSGEKGRSNS